MQCWHCGATVRPTAKICIYCGEALADDAFDRDVEFAREQEYESARQPTPMSWTYEEPERNPTPMYRPGAVPERQPAPLYRPGGDPAVPDQSANAMPPRDAAPARDVTPKRRGLLSPARGFVPSDDSHAPREPRRGAPGARPRGDTPLPPRPRAPEYDEHGHERDRHEGGGGEDYRRSRDGDEQRSARRPPQPGPEGWDEPGRSHDRGSADRYGSAAYDGYDDDQRGHRGERGPGRERDRGHEREQGRERERERDDGGHSGGRSRRGHDEDDGYGAPRRNIRDDYDAYPDESRDGRGSRYDPRGGWDEPAPRAPLEDSWGLPALTGPEASVRSWTDEWQSHAGGPPDQQWAQPPRERDYGPVQPARPSRRPAPGKTARRKQGGRGLIVVLLLAIGLAIIAGGILLGGRVLHRLGLGGSASTGAPTFATYTPGPTPTVVAGFKQFASAPSAYVLNYPQDWSQSSQNDTSQGQPDYLDTFAQGGTSVTIERSPAFDPAADTDIIQGEVRGGQQAGLTFTETTSAAGLAAIGGEQWTRREYDVNGQNGKEHMAIFACHHNGHGFAIVLRAPAGSYAQLYSTSFKTLLSSFRFTS